MRSAIAFLAFAGAAFVASSAPAETSSASSHVLRHTRHAPHSISASVAPTPAHQAPNEAFGPLSWLTRLFPSVKPYPSGEGDVDGLSRDIEDCNKGCIDNPIR